jgi:hypothetical protein
VLVVVLQAKGARDWVWVVSVHENPQQIRAVLVKGGRHPAAVPRPMLQLLPFQLPLCGLALDKGAIEVRSCHCNYMSYQCLCHSIPSPTSLQLMLALLFMWSASRN